MATLNATKISTGDDAWKTAFSMHRSQWIPSHLFILDNILKAISQQLLNEFKPNEQRS